MPSLADGAGASISNLVFGGPPLGDPDRHYRASGAATRPWSGLCREAAPGAGDLCAQPVRRLYALCVARTGARTRYESPDAWTPITPPAASFRYIAKHAGAGAPMHGVRLARVTHAWHRLS